MKKLLTFALVTFLFVLSGMPLGVYADNSGLDFKQCASSVRTMCVLES